MIKFLSGLYFDLTGWKYINRLPADLKKFVVIGCPHTSNWDFWLAMTFFQKSGIKGRFTIKKQWLRFPFKTIFTALGALGVDRDTIKKSGGLNLTDYMAKLLMDADKMVLMVTPEGTRNKVTEWKTGFYHTAVKANVPIVLAYGDYGKKELGIGLIIYPKNFEEDMQIIMNFYKKITPKVPSNFSVDLRYDKLVMDNRPLIYACSGCSNVAQLANDLAVRIRDTGIAQMSCIAGVGGNVAPIEKLAHSGRKILAIDGCPLNCSKECLAKINIVPTEHIEISTDYKIKKNNNERYVASDLDIIFDDINRKISKL